MSFILDALKKLEEKRRNESVPDLTTVHIEGRSGQNKRPLMPYLLVAVLLLNAVVFAAWLRPTQPAKEQIQAPSPVVPLPEQVMSETAFDENLSQDIAGEDRMPSTTETDAPVINPSPEELMTLRSRIKEEQDLIDSTPAPEPDYKEKVEQKAEKTVLDLGQVPLDIRRGLPDINIKGHIYSNDPSSRLVNINGNIIREGGMVMQGLTVDEITMSGVVFDYEGLLFHIRVF